MSNFNVRSKVITLIKLPLKNENVNNLKKYDHINQRISFQLIHNKLEEDGILENRRRLHINFILIEC
jgi:hypothetical protein